MRIAILDDYQNLALKLADWSAVAKQCEITVFDRHLSEDEAAETLRDFEILCLMRERMPVPRSLLERLPKLKLLAITGHQHRTLDLAAARDLGIMVTCTERRGSGPFATAELAWGLILSLARHLPQEVDAMRSGGWQSTLGMALSGKRLGVVGLGRLGSHMVPIAKAFHMDVVAWSQNMTPEAAEAKGARHVDKHELFATSDFVSLHVVLSERTRHLVGAKEFDAMQPSAYLVNTSRGPLVDRTALLAALKSRRIAGAALDTFDAEPLPDDDELRTLPNALLTPHLGYTVRELMQVFYEDTVENLLAYMSGRPIRVVGQK